MIIPNTLDHIPASKGSYLLMFTLDQTLYIDIGKYREVFFQEGNYLYAGSAFGPGGLNARVKRHLSTDKKKKWHLDWIRPSLSFISGWYILGKNLECEWSQKISRMDGVFIPLFKMGASDCKQGCPAHFLGLSKGLTPQDVEQIILTEPGAVFFRFC